MYLSKKITEAYECIDDTSKESKIKLFDAFNAIQLWGGKMGKGFYIENTDTNLEDRLQQGELIKEKWINNVDAIYRGIVKSIKYNKFTISKLEDGFNDINGMGVAFATKHLNFWSTKCKIDVLPIYDSFIYQILFAKVSGNPNWRYYNKYVESLKELKLKFDNKFTITDLERALFAYCKIIGIKYNKMLLDLINLKEKYNLDIKGVIHIGAHFGQEYETYEKLNIDKIIFFEPHPKSFSVLYNKLFYCECFC
jgi:hypothetical protein